MKCSHICEWNNWGHDVGCFRPANEKCPMVMTVEEFDQKAKADGGKPHPSYVPVQGIRAVMNIREYGTNKYGNPENWRNVSFERYHEAFLRHVLEMWNDPFAVDAESGYRHLDHVLCNGFFMAALMEERDTDDEAGR